MNIVSILFLLLTNRNNHLQAIEGQKQSSTSTILSEMESSPSLSSSSFSIDNILKPDKCDSSQEPRSADRALTLAERLAGKYIF